MGWNAAREGRVRCARRNDPPGAAVFCDAQPLDGWARISYNKIYLVVSNCAGMGRHTSGEGATPDESERP